MTTPRTAFGRPVNPHLFRDVAATTLARDQPAQVRLAAPLLGHRSFSTTERHYNLARLTEAATAWHDLLKNIADRNDGEQEMLQTGCPQAGQVALADHAALELGQGCEQVEHQSVARGGGVDRPCRLLSRQPCGT